ncbi:LIC_10190 family membrane protein [Hymenobacter sp. 15J16-1T3B]|uniref:LIC_10190 family membrane protein n=1 Tax=Hymenobacter sp. 15J16-1T3B TaxID=2886941 RepID=UPI0021D45BD1|nr:hypothetical protein [Hymenobacter sp. 15J16-1T3B]
MILVVLVWLVAAVGSTALGVGAWRLAARLGLGGASDLPAPEWLSLTGLALLTAALQVWSLAAPVDGRAQLVFGLGLGAVLLLNRRAWVRAVRGPWPRRWGAAERVGALLLALLLGWLLTFAAQVPINYDVGLYQLQTLQWTERFAAVPGLGNLHGRLAFNSSLYLPLALFRVGTPAGPAYALSSYLYALLAVAAVRALVAGLRAPQPDARPVWAPLLLLLLLVYSFQVWLSSVTSDCTTAALMVLLFLYYAQHPPQRATEAQRLLLTLLAAWAVTLKLSAAPVLLLPLYAVWAAPGRQRVGRRWGGPLALGLLLGLPWLARNVVLSGYLVYPLPALDWFAVDWKLPRAYARMEHNMIVNLARNSAQSPYAAPHQTLWEWWPNWWAPMAGFPGAVVVAALASPLVAAWRWRRPRSAAEQGWAGGWLVAWAGSVFWFVAAPDYRFGVGFLLVAALWPWLGPRWPGPAQTGRLRYLPGLLLLLWLLQQLRDPLYQLRHDPARFALRAVWPELPAVPATVAVPVAPGLFVRVPREGFQCWGAPLPCAHCAEAGLRLRGRTLAEGFRRTE